MKAVASSSVGDLISANAATRLLRRTAEATSRRDGDISRDRRGNGAQTPAEPAQICSFSEITQSSNLHE
jgi:hypothetical protein